MIQKALTTDEVGKKITLVAATREGDYFPMVTEQSALRVTFSQPCPSIPYAGFLGDSFNVKTGRDTQVEIEWWNQTRYRDAGETDEEVFTTDCPNLGRFCQQC